MYVKEKLTLRQIMKMETFVYYYCDHIALPPYFPE